MQFKKSKQQQQTNSNATRHRVAASDQMVPIHQTSQNMRVNFDRRSLVDVNKYSSTFSPNTAGPTTIDSKNQHYQQQFANQQAQYIPTSNHVRSDSPSQFDELDIDEHEGMGADEDFGELNEFEEQLIEPTEYQDIIQSIHPQGAIGSDSYHTLQNKYNKKQTSSFAKTQSFAQAASNFSSPQSSTAMIQSQPMAQVKPQTSTQNDHNNIIRHNRFQNLINNKHRANNRQINQNMVNGFDKSDLAKRQIQMIQNLPPSVVLNSTKTKLSGKNCTGILSKALSTHVSPSASSTSFIVQNNKNGQGQGIGGQIKMSDVAQPIRDNKGSGHTKYKQTPISGYGRPTDFLSQQSIAQAAATKLKIRKFAADGQPHAGPASQSNSLNRQKLIPKDQNTGQILNDQGLPFSDIKKERTFDGKISNAIQTKHKQQPLRVNKDSSALTGPQSKLKIKMQGSFQQNFSSQSSSSKMITGIANDGSSINMAQSSGQLILQAVNERSIIFPNKRPVAGTTVVSADPSPRAASITAHGDSNNKTQVLVQSHKLSKQNKTGPNTMKQIGKQCIPNSVPGTSLSTPVNFSPSGDNGALKQRKVVVVGSRATFQQQIHPASKGSSNNQVSQGPHPGSKQQFRQSNNQQLRKILRNNLVSVQLGETDQGSAGRCADADITVNKRNATAGLALKNSYCTDGQQKFFDAQNQLGNALVSRTQQVNPAQIHSNYTNQQYLSMNMARAPQSSTGSKSGEGAPIQYKTVASQGQPLSQQQQQQKSNINKPQMTKQTQAKSFMLREKDVQFSNQYQQVPSGRLSISKQPALIKSRDSSSKNVHPINDDDLHMDLVNSNKDQIIENLNSINTAGHSTNYQPGSKTKQKLQTDSYNQKMLNSMLRRNGEQDYSEDRNLNQPAGQSRAAATGLVTLKGFGTATGYRTAQVSAHVSAHTSKNHSNNSSQVRPQQFSGTANQIGNKIFYHGPSSISGSLTGNSHLTNLGTQLQKHGQLGSTLKQQKKNNNSINIDSATSNTNQVSSKIVKKGNVNNKKNIPGSISQDTSEQNNFSGITSGTTTILRKHGIVSQSNSKLNSFHSNQVTAGGVSRESSYKQKKHEKYDSQISTTANRFKFDASNRQSIQDEESSQQKNSRTGLEVNQFKGTHVIGSNQNGVKNKQRTNSTTNNKPISDEQQQQIGRVPGHTKQAQSQANSIKKKALQPSHPSQSNASHKAYTVSQRAERTSARNDSVTPSQSTSKRHRQLSGGAPRNILTPGTNTNNTTEKVQIGSNNYQTPTSNGQKVNNQFQKQSPLRNVMDYKDCNPGSQSKSGAHKKQTQVHNLAIKNDQEDKKSDSSMNSQKLQMQQYYSDIQRLKDHIKSNFGSMGTMMKSTSDFYRIGRVLGRGAFGKVNLACHKISEHLVAIKSIEYAVLRNEKEHKRRLMQEMSILKQSAHQNVVKLYDSFETSKHMCFVMELCQGGDLLSYVRKRRKLKEDNAKYLFKQMVSGLQYIHSKKYVVHRDIKLDNILIDQSGQIKICDFGVSKQLKSENEKMFEQCGTPAYVAPEVIGQKGYRGFKADMWSAGVCLYVMLLGTVPFRSNTMEDLHKLILKGRFDFQGEKLSNEAKDLICGLIQVNYRKRLNAKQALDHPWLQKTQEGNEPIDINRPDLADVIFTENEKQNIKNHYLCRLEKLKKKRFNQRKKIINQNQSQHSNLATLQQKNQLYQSQCNALGKQSKGVKTSQQSQLEYKMQSQMQRTFTEGDFIFTEHNLDTKEDELQERKTAKERIQQKEKINNLFQKSPSDPSSQDGGQFNKFEAFDIKPKVHLPNNVTNKDGDCSNNNIPSVLLKNISEKSIIYAPFNSSFTDFDEDQPHLFKWPEEVVELMQPKRSKIIKFSKRCRDLNREYEENNNADLDNGVYNAFVNEQEMEAERQQQEEMMLQAKKEDELKKTGKQLNNSVCDSQILDGDINQDNSDHPNIVLNLNGLKDTKKQEKQDIFKFEEKGMDVLNSQSSSSQESDDLDFSPQDSSNNRIVRGFNVSPSSMVEGKGRSRDQQRESLNSSRMTGTQELSIHEGMQVIHEIENQHNLKHVKAKKQKNQIGAQKESNEVIFNIGSLNTDKLLKKDSTQNITENSIKLEQQQELDIDDNIVQYTVEQFLDENYQGQITIDSDLKSQNKNTNRIEKKQSNVGIVSNKSSQRQPGLYQVGTNSKNSVATVNQKNKNGVLEYNVALKDNGEYQNYRIGSNNSGSCASSQVNNKLMLNNQNQNNIQIATNQKTNNEQSIHLMASNMKVQLYQCLKTHNLNYLTAAYYLTQKHEFN